MGGHRDRRTGRTPEEDRDEPKPRREMHACSKIVAPLHEQIQVKSASGVLIPVKPEHRPAVPDRIPQLLAVWG